MIEQIHCIKEIKINQKNYKSNNIRKFIIMKRKNRRINVRNKENKNETKEDEILYDIDIESE